MNRQTNLQSDHSNTRRARSLSMELVSGLICLLDGFVVFCTGFVIYLLYLGWRDDVNLTNYLAVLIFDTLLTVHVFWLFDLYLFKAITRPQHHLRKILSVGIIKFLVLIAFLFIFKISSLFSRFWIFSWLLSSLTLICIGRIAVAQIIIKLSRSGQINKKIILVGGGDQAKKLLQHYDSVDEPWNKIVGIFDDRTERVGSFVMGHPVLGNLDDLIEYIRQNNHYDILVALPWSAEQRVLDILQKLSVLPVNIGLIPDLAGMHFIPCRWSSEGGVPALNVFRKPISGWEYFLKILEDRILGGLILLVSLPVMIVIAILIKLESKGPVFFTQFRYGFNNKLIRVFKFRTMKVDCQDEHAERLVSPGDERLTRLGAFLRRTSLDELPQFFNVLRGEMSIVGPRPHAIKAKAGEKLYQDVVDDYAARHKVKPGITGWAQVNGWRGETDTQKKLVKRVELDIWYIENWSLPFDLKIILYTVWICIRGHNAH